MEKQQINKFENDATNEVFAGCLSPSLVCIAAIILSMLLGSCKTRERVVAVNAVRTDTVRLSSSIRDSIYLHDSIYIRDKGDTVWIERWHTRWRDRTVHDTTYISKTDSVPVPYPVEVKVPRELTWWQKTLQRTGGIALILLLVWIGRQAWKIYTKRFY